MSFREHYQKNYLKESPMRLGLSYPDVLDNDALNQEQAQDYIITQQKIEDIDFYGMQLAVYRDKNDNKVYDSFINKTPFIKCSYIYTEEEDSMYILDVWNQKMSRGLALRLLFGYYLPKHKAVISDNKHTTQGERFWKKIIEKGETEGYMIKVLVQGKEVELNDVEKFWGSTPEFYDYQLKIFSKDA